MGEEYTGILAGYIGLIGGVLTNSSLASLSGICFLIVLFIYLTVILIKTVVKKNYFYISLNRLKVKWYSSFPLHETYEVYGSNPQGLEELNSKNSNNLSSFFYLLLIGASCAIFVLHKGQLFSLSKLLIFCSFVGYILLQILGFLAENICYILPLISIILNLFIDRLSGIPIFRKINLHRYLGGRVFIKQGLFLIFVGWISYFLYHNFQSPLINIIESPYF